mgnify:CR=1 FL=1
MFFTLFDFIKSKSKTVTLCQLVKVYHKCEVCVKCNEMILLNLRNAKIIDSEKKIFNNEN